MSDILSLTADAALNLQQPDGSFPPAQNGPYEHQLTPVRTTSGWIRVLAAVYNHTKDSKYQDAGSRAVDYLLSDELRPAGASFHCRNKPGLDHCNGLVGQALAIEALVAAANSFDRPDAAAIARDVFLSHPFHDNWGVWSRVEITGNELTVDRTFNHQVLFAAAGAAVRSISDSKTVDRQIRSFLSSVPSNMAQHPSGIIVHRLRPKAGLADMMQALTDSRTRPMVIDPILHRLRDLRKKHDSERRIKELGYQAVNLYGLALLRSRVPDHSIWEDDTIANALDVIQSADYKRHAKSESEWFQNTPIGFQNAYAHTVFSYGSREEAEYWVNEQLRQSFDWNTHLLSKNTVDKQMLASAMYTATDLLDMPLFVPN